MAAALRFSGLMTVDEFLNWDSPGDYLWQLIDGVPVAMSPPVPLHGAIQNEVGSLIRNHLVERGKPCTVITTPGVIPRSHSDRDFVVPDLAVTCSHTDVTGKAVHEPVLLIEILSPTNHAETWRNVWAYLTIPTLWEILVIRTSSVGVELLCRDDNHAWPDKPLAITGGDFTLGSIGLNLAVAALDRGTGMTDAVRSEFLFPRLADRVWKIAIQRERRIRNQRVDAEMKSFRRLPPSRDPIERGVKLRQIPRLDHHMKFAERIRGEP